MRSVLSCVLVASVAGAVAFPVTLRAQDEAAQLQRDCDAGNAVACFNLGVKRLPGSVDDAVKLFERACDLENATGCEQLTYMYRQASGVPKDSARADSLWQRAQSLHDKACELRDAGSCLRRADMGPPLAGIISAMQRACEDFERGDYCLKLGLRYDLGYGVPRDTVRASELFKKACLFDTKEACSLIRR